MIRRFRVNFYPLDSWSFTRPKPMGAPADIGPETLFPPPHSTLIGALRHLIGDLMAVNWEAFNEGNQPVVKAIIGEGEGDTGQLKFSYPQIFLADSTPTHTEQSNTEPTQRTENSKLKDKTKTELLFPVPQFLVTCDAEGNAKSRQSVKSLSRLAPLTEPVHTDLGVVYLPGHSKATQAIQQHWLKASAIGLLADTQNYTQSQLKQAFIPLDSLVTVENRTGIAVSQSSRNVDADQFYQSKHLRLGYRQSKNLFDQTIETAEVGLSLVFRWQYDESNAVEINKVIDKLISHRQVVRLGGESRMATVTVEEIIEANSEKRLTRDNQNSKSDKAILIMQSPGDFGDWLPPDFELCQYQNGGANQPSNNRQINISQPGQAWKGFINDIEVIIYSAIIGKPLKPGGWDAKKRETKPLRPLVPPGSCYFIQCSDPQRLFALNGQLQLGHYQNMGLGECLVIPDPRD